MIFIFSRSPPGLHSKSQSQSLLNYYREARAKSGAQLKVRFSAENVSCGFAPPHHFEPLTICVFGVIIFGIKRMHK